MENNQSAARAARRFLDDRVRSDWGWPTRPAYWSASDEEVRGITEFRERYYGDSSPSSGEDDVDGDPYKFDSPDSIGDSVERKARSRKRKRRIALEEEMKENEGLRIWVERRDVWTGAAAVKKYGTERPAKDAFPTERQTSRASAEPTSSEISTPMETDSGSTSRHSEDPAPTTSITTTDEALVPLAHPLLVSNTIRQSISPKTYPDIYNKIVMSSRTPSVPINLADMTKALVQGWQENGEWPPRAAVLDPLAGKKRALAGVKTREHAGEPFFSHHPHLKKGVNSVKRIFHLDGHGHEAGHGGGNGG